jgi:hypothetical protein
VERDDGILADLHGKVSGWRDGRKSGGLSAMDAAVTKPVSAALRTANSRQIGLFPGCDPAPDASGVTVLSH